MKISAFSYCLVQILSFGVIVVSFSRLKIEFRLRRCQGAWPVLHRSLLVMNRLNKTDLAIFISSKWFLLSTDLTDQNLFTFTAASVVTCGGLKRSPRTSL